LATYSPVIGAAFFGYRIPRYIQSSCNAACALRECRSIAQALNPFLGCRKPTVAQLSNHSWTTVYLLQFGMGAWHKREYEWINTTVLRKNSGLHDGYATGDQYGDGEIEQPTQKETWIPDA
jgi:hypothetical protein